MVISYSQVADLRRMREPELSNTRQALQQIQSTPEGQAIFQQLLDANDGRPILFQSGDRNGAGIARNGNLLINISDQEIHDTALPTAANDGSYLHLNYIGTVFHELTHHTQPQITVEEHREHAFNTWKSILGPQALSVLGPLGLLEFDTVSTLLDDPQAVAAFAAAHPELRSVAAELHALDQHLLTTPNELDAIRRTNDFTSKYLDEPWRQMTHDSVPKSRLGSNTVYGNSADVASPEIAQLNINFSGDNMLFDFNGDQQIDRTDLDLNGNGTFDYDDLRQLADKVRAAGVTFDLGQFTDQATMLGDLNRVLTAYNEAPSNNVVER